MADDPIIDDALALSYVEGLENWAKGVKFLAAVTRFVRNARKEIPMLREDLARLRAEKALAEQSAKEQAEVQEALAAMRRELASSEAATHRLREEAGVLREEVARNRDKNQALDAARVTLEGQVKALKEEHATFKNRMAAMLREER